MKNLIAFLQELREQNFFGSLEVKFENGRVVLLKKTATLKPENLAMKQEEGGSLWSQSRVKKS